MQLKPQKYTDATYAEAVASGCNIVQQKIRGVWVRLVVSRGFARVYDAYGEEARPAIEVDEKVCCTLIGDCIHTLPDKPIVVWDCWEVGDPNGERPVYTNIENFSYRDRFAFLKVKWMELGTQTTITPIGNFPITKALYLWDNQQSHHCGLVYRRASDPVDTVLMVSRFYPEIPGGLV